MSRLNSSFNIIQVLRWFILVVGIFPWILYAMYINVGLESLIDEGQMLLLPNRPKPLGHLGSQSGVLIGFVVDHFDYTANVLLWTRYWMQCISVGVMLVASWLFLNSRYNQKINILYYSGIFLLINSICLYLFTKTVSYNHVQQFTVLLSISLYFLYHTYNSNQRVRRLCLVGMGFWCLIGILNISPSGLAFSTFLLFILLAEIGFSRRGALQIFTCFGVGALIGLTFFHFALKSLLDLSSELLTMYTMINKLNRSYDSYSIYYKLLKSLLSLFVVCIFSLGILSVYQLFRDKFHAPMLARLLSALSLVSLIIYSITFTETGKIYEWTVMPLVISLFVAFYNDVHGELKEQKWILIFLIGVPIIAPLGTNLLITYKFGYFFATWLVATILLMKGMSRELKFMVTFLFLGVGMVWNFQFFIDLSRKAKLSNVQSSTLTRLENIYITPKQKNYFENVYAQLKKHKYVEGDTLIAFQPDLMTIFAVGGAAGQRVYFVPQDLLTDDLSALGRPKYIILNDYSYEQICSTIKERWGFPDQYEKIDIGSPEAVDYFNADKPRMLFCLK